MNPKVIGEGSYGCVHKPSLTCEKKPEKLSNYNNKISKILDKEEASLELKEFEKIKLIDMNTNFHSGTPIKCDPLQSKEQLNAVKKCKNKTIKHHVKWNFNNIKANLSLLIMEDGGVDLRKYVNKISSRNISNSSTKSVEKFLIEFERAFLGLKELEDSKYIHNDLKLDNMVYNKDINRINFIDFGLTTDFNTLKKNGKKNEYYVGNNHHWSFPPDIIYINKSEYKNVNKKDNIQTIIKDIIFDGKNIAHWYNTFMNQTYPDYDKVLYKDVWKYRNLDIENTLKSIKTMDYEEFVKIASLTIDSYGVGMALSYSAFKFKKFIPDSTFQQIRALSEIMTNWDINKRLTSSQLLSNYQNILHTTGILNKHNLHIDQSLDVPLIVKNKKKTIKNIPIKIKRDKKVPPSPGLTIFAPNVLRKSAIRRLELSPDRTITIERPNKTLKTKSKSKSKTQKYTFSQKQKDKRWTAQALRNEKAYLEDPSNGKKNGKKYSYKMKKKEMMEYNNNLRNALKIEPESPTAFIPSK
jgi:serine/threonine protein kinase